MTLRFFKGMLDGHALQSDLQLIRVPCNVTGVLSQPEVAINYK